MERVPVVLQNFSREITLYALVGMRDVDDLELGESIEICLNADELDRLEAEFMDTYPENSDNARIVLPPLSSVRIADDIECWGGATNLNACKTGADMIPSAIAVKPEQPVEPVYCPACGGEADDLGDLEWHRYRCRICFADFSTPAYQDND